MAAIAAHTASISVAATDVNGGANLLGGLKDFSAKDSATMLDITDFADTTGAKKKLAGLKDAAISLSGDYSQADAPQALLRAVAGSTLYVTILPDGTNGFSYPCIVSDYEVKGSVDGLVEISVSLVGNGARVAKP